MRMHWDAEGGRYEFEATYAERKLIRGKGATWWDPVHKCWYTRDLTTALKFKHVASDACLQVLEAAEHALNRSIEASSASESSYELPAPPGLEYLPFQKAGIAYALKRDSTLIADEMGLGKTVQALGYINAMQLRIGRVLVVCPASVKLHWFREANRWLQAPFDPIIHNGSNLPSLSDFHIVNWDLLSRFEAAHPERDFDLIIVDEAHLAKNPRTARTKALKKLLKRSSHRLLLTGTPILNRPMDLFNLLQSVDPTIFPNWKQYGLRFCDGFHDGFRWNFSGASNLDDLQAILRSRIMVRRLKADVLPELPAKTRSVIEIPADRPLLKSRKAAETDVKQDLLDRLWQWRTDGGPNDPYLASNLFHVSQLRQETARTKCVDVARFVKQILESENKLIVFAHHKTVVSELMRLLDEYDPVKLTGESSDAERQEAVDGFQNDPQHRVFIGNLQAAGTGITLTAARTVVFAELDWVPANMSQAEDRAHRIGQTDNVNVYHVVLEDSIDAYIAHRLVEKQKVIDEALDQRRINGSS